MLYNQDKMLVVARKYNDIFYAISTEEWDECSKHYLLMITDRLDQNSYPMQQMFDKIFSIHTSLSILGIVKLIFSLRKLLRNLDFNVVTISNIVIVANLFILNNRKVKKIVMLEDGLMNYDNFTPSKSKLKHLFVSLLSINVNEIIQKIKYCYLLKPSNATYYYGKKKLLNIKSELFLNYLSVKDLELNEKSIFVGQPLYRTNNIMIDEYSKSVNNFIIKNNIDYYLPHTMSSNKENINCKKLDLLQIQSTLEILSSIYNLKLYSFSSSVLYTTKLINKNTKTYAVSHPLISSLEKKNIIYTYIDGHYKI